MLLIWVPFLFAVGLFFWWRLVYLPTTLTVDPNDPVLLKTIISSPHDGIYILTKTALQDIGYMLTSVWSGTLTFDKLNIFLSKIASISWFMAIPMAIIFAFYIRKYYRDESSTEDRYFLKMLLLGSVILVAGSLPVWAAGKQIAIGKWSDRFTLAPDAWSGNSRCLRIGLAIKKQRIRNIGYYLFCWRVFYFFANL